MTLTTYNEALENFKHSIAEVNFKTQQIQFCGVGEKDVYNITAPFECSGKTVIGGRVESRDSEHSQVFFFEEVNGVWTPIPGAQTFNLQDPFFTRVGDELIVGGVEIFPAPCGTPNKLSWRTIFYRGKDIYSLEKMFQGPEHMKDIRVVELADGRIGVFTRPQGERGGRGKIGYTQVNQLSELTEECINQAELLEQFHDDEWGGANEIHLLSNGKLGVLAHIAKFSSDESTRHYAACAFLYDPKSNEYSKVKMIACRELFNEGAAKRPDLQDVIFSGGLKRLGNGRAVLYAGAGDAEAHWLEIADPFTEWEQN
ncbi:hypothetical protein LNTAR_05559 [Lentisphaera araneosa HTCC2155]|uniref:DUF1861 family protein n=1 Tax=Lentisphaera araneosa HTCC2155 TaxID=313628 RepID=A6DPC0_9BACT|nr:DUF1861 family protein [Lentisphaera araneosa]EDM26416.1 hypothetical protein LNTAR_05559 [Lentisphaera araneosa HTCC2155]